ncbi:MAG: signal peptide peptidase SppA [Capnocytophaga sp.]|nr:signal peptide peptidase SppA [Capnocytophaga sp.]
MNFLKNVLATIIGFFISIGILFFFFLILGIMFGVDNEKVKVKENSILELDFTTPIADFAQKTIIEDLDYVEEEKNNIDAILDAIKYAKTDEKIKGISIKSLEGIQSFSQAQAIRKAVEDFKNSGKFVYSFQENYGQTEYFLHSVSDSIFLGTLGNVEVTGLNTTINYYKDFEDKTGIKFEVIRHGKYKSAVEPFLTNTMSEENREQYTTLLRSYWDSFATEIRQSRNISEKDFEQLTDSLWGRTPELALQHNLVDKICFQDEFENALLLATKTNKIKDLHYISVEDYLSFVPKEKKDKNIKSNITIIYAVGVILDGESTPQTVGNETTIKAIREARDDENTKAIVLYVNSPGGSGLASELIHREIELAKKQKPVYVSMGDYAASGGYYISCNANRIFAENTTITGSIGVFSRLLNLKGLADKVGINNEQVATHANSFFYSPLEEMPENTRKLLTEGIEDFYKKFVQRVADGRNMSWEQVDEIAQGRVWTGKDAVKNGLVDEIGSLQDVIAYAVKEQKLDNYKIVRYPDVELDFKQIFRNKFGIFLKEEVQSIIKEEIGIENYEMYKKINTQSKNYKGIQAQIPYLLELK